MLTYGALPEQITDANNGVWLWRYDKKGNLVSRTDPAGATSHYTYNSQGRLIDLTDAAEQITYLRYDGQQNISHVMTPSGQISSYQYDQLGRLTHLTDARGDVRRRHYDALGQLLAVREADGTERVFAYDGESNVLRAKDAKRTVEFHYAGLNQLVTRTEAGLQVDFAYNTEGQLMSLQNEQGERYQFELDAAGQVVTEIGFDGLTRRYQRDAAGRVTEIQRAGGRFTRYNYDAVGRVLAVVHNDEAPITYAYGPNGALREARTAGSTVVLERDVLGRVLVETQGAHTVSSTYNQRGQRLQLHSSLGAELALERNDLGDITQAQAGSWFSRIERDEQGLELQRTLSGGVQQRWHRDGRGRPTSQHITAGGTTLRRRQYHWQGLDQLTQIDDSLLGATTYSYDVLSNLTGARYADGAEELRQPDAVGNLFRTLARTDRKYNKGGQLREANGTRYRYDEEGNLVRKTLPDGQQWHYRWDGAGQLTSVTRPDGYAVAFAYDALGRRISKRFRGKITRWVWDGNKPLHEWQELEVGPGAGSVADLTTWLFEEGSFAPMAKLTARGSYSVLTDHLGTPLELYDQAGAKTWQAQLDSYGQVRAGKGKPQDCPFRYQGQYEDTETGLYYNRFRYYDPEAGRYISQDPTRLAGGNSLYGYVRNPTSWLDVLGWMPWPNPTRQGHHLVYQNKASGVPGLEHFADANTPTYFFNEPYVPGSHEAIHAAQRPYVGPRQGAWTGSADELLEASGKGLSHPSISNIRGELREIGSGKVHASNVTPDEAFQKLMEWHKSKSTGSCPP